MADKSKDDSTTREQDEAALQEELRREAAEGADSIGDVASNRNLSGSSTWETQPGSSDASGAAG